MTGTIGYTLIAVLFASCLLITVAAPPGSPLRTLFSTPQLTGLGKYSYGIYVIHAPVIWFLQQGGLRADMFPRYHGSTMPGELVFSVIGVTISVSLAVASYHYWEAPFLRLKRYLPYAGHAKTAGDPGDAATTETAAKQPVTSGDL